ncbi:hypothetical protein ACGFJC_15815 [Nonomuraea fuscirosea]|jgi:hypothetical protein|uniref:Uncharacterized protein n=1 Tax=Nonomuraea fuscirosea TaxID=1291556 RepID=A0A2T0MW86_9ACTN|nr:hypothetical protein [Nonomuraea fuscirosea]PRX63209.1 hypothetical protein B0I32_111203 [Nonomuraea fuscirosea]WSA50789.1 hypothetical protein OIE67_43110 [Nonomuraea fuscirosea]
MRTFALGALTGVLAATIAASLLFALTDHTSPATTTRSAPVTAHLGDG